METSSSTLDPQPAAAPATQAVPAGVPHFWERTFSDNGEPSSSRVLSAYLSVIVSVILIGLFWFLCHVKDSALLTLWLAALPGVIYALIAVALSAYGINKFTGTGSDFFNGISSWIKNRNQQ